MNWRKDKREKKEEARQQDRTPDLVHGRRDVHSTRPQPCSLETRLCVRSHCHAFFFFSCPFFNSFCLFYLQHIPHYLFTQNYFPLHDTQRNRTNFRFSLVNQLVDHWSCAMASFWDFKIICVPSIISKAEHGRKYLILRSSI